MQLEELKLITASNIINLRTRAGMTQAELGYKLNYSDKTISKWERAEAIPDAFVLKQMGEIFGVTVDDLLSSHDEWKPIPTEEPETEEVSYSTVWQVFVVALPVSILVYMILICVFHRKQHLQHVIAAFVLSLFLAAYLLVYPRYHPWQLFLIVIPAEIIVYLSCNLKNPPKPLKIKHSTNRREKQNNG